jgi:AmmeMemoRadiSam system protein B
MSHVRSPAVAGMFYPESRQELQQSIDNYLQKASTDKHVTETQLKALIVPHAGYIYSGSTAAQAYANLALYADQISRVVLLGPAHRVYIQGIGISSAESFRTPLGDIPIDKNFQTLIEKNPYVQVSDNAHLQEHSLEVQLPFLQTVLGEFSLVPLVVGDVTAAQVEETLEQLWGGNETIIIISSDLSHFLSYDRAQRLDRKTCNAIEQLNPETISHEQACGGLAIKGLLHLAAQRHMQVSTLGLCNSGDTAGNHSSVVGYGSWAFTEQVVS